MICPAYNEEATIEASVHASLLLSYPRFEIIVVNDGSKDETLTKIIQRFEMQEGVIIPAGKLVTQHIKAIYHSKIYPNLKVIDKANGGKSDALNAGINLASYQIVCGVDADSILDENALLRAAVPFSERPQTMVFTGGTVRLSNGSRLEYGRIVSTAINNNPLVWMQAVEYLRAFLFGRLGWDTLNATTIISGAFGLFSKEAIIEVGGYSTKTIGEDMELVMRIHKYKRDHKIPYEVEFIPDPVCWTECPETLQDLGKQRMRWQRGLASVVSSYRHLIFNPKYGVLGMVALPYQCLYELLGCVLEPISYIFTCLAFAFDWIDGRPFLTFLTVGIVFQIFISLLSIVIEQTTFQRYTRLRDLLLDYPVFLKM